MGGVGRDFWEDFERRESMYVLWTAIPNPKRRGWGRTGMPSGQTLIATAIITKKTAGLRAFICVLLPLFAQKGIWIVLMLRFEA